MLGSVSQKNAPKLRRMKVLMKILNAVRGVVYDVIANEVKMNAEFVSGLQRTKRYTMIDITK